MNFFLGFIIGLAICFVGWVIVQVFLAWWFVVGGLDGIRETHAWNKAQRKLKKEKKKA